MKQPLIYSGAAVLVGLILSGGPNHAQEASPKDPYKKTDAKAAEQALPAQKRNISLHLEDFSLSAADAATLLREPMSDSERLERVLRWVKEGKAYQEQLVVARTLSGQRMVAESIDEWRYPTEFEPPDLQPSEFEPPKDAPKDAKNVIVNMPIPRPKGMPTFSREQLAVMGPTPTAFETRNCGQTLEIEPTLRSDGKRINLNLVPQIVRFTGDHEASGAPLGQREGTAMLRVLQPHFSTQKITTSAAAEVGIPYFLGTRSRPSHDGVAKENPARQVVLTFITPHVVTAGGDTLDGRAEAASPNQISATPEESAQISLRFEDFSLSLADAAALMREPLNDKARLDRVLKMMETGKVRQELIAVVRTTPGQRAVTESIDEFRYMTEISVNPMVKIQDRGTEANPDAPKTAPDARSAEAGGAFAGQITGMSVTPTSFETRNVGMTIEVEPVLGPYGKTIDLNVVPQLVRYFGDHNVSPDLKFGQPTFETQKITTSVSIEPNKPFLIGTKNLPYDDGIAKPDPERTVWLEFVTGEVITAQGRIVGIPPAEKKP